MAERGTSIPPVEDNLKEENCKTVAGGLRHLAMKQHVDCKTANLAKSESLSTKSDETITTTTLGSTQLIVKKETVRQNKSLKEGATNKTKIGIHLILT